MFIRSLIASGALMVLVSASIVAGDVDLEDVKCLFNPRGAAKAETAVEFNGGHVYFCCNNCKGKFAEDPEQFATKANQQLFITKQYVQTKCPISGRDINPEMTAKVGNSEVGLCCGGCKGKVEGAEGDAQAELVFSADAFKKGFELVKEDDGE